MANSITRDHHLLTRNLKLNDNSISNDGDDEGISITDAGAVAISGTIELGHATDTTLARSGSGDVTIEGNAIYRAGGTDVAVADGGTGASNSNAWLNSRITTNANGSLNYDATGATAVNHDSLTGFVANEHIDWTADSAGTIHASNYTDTTTNTQNEYATSWVDSTNDVLLRLTESGAGSGTQDIKLVAGTGISLTPSGTDMTIASTVTDTNTMGSGFTVSASTDSNATTITQGDDLMFTAGTGITCETTADGTVTITNTVSDTNTTYSAGDLLDLSTTTFNVDLTEANEAAIANGDYILFLDGGATGSHAKEAVHDLATLFAGAGLTATNSVIAVDSSQAITALTGGDLTIYEDANNADVSLKMGTSASEALSIEVLNGASNKTAEEIKIMTKTASGTVNHGKISVILMK